MVERRKFAELGGADNGWLKAKPTLPMRCISTCGATILTPYEVIDALPGVPRDSSGPVFAEPWQAQIFALTVQLSQAGYFRWCESADTLETSYCAKPSRLIHGMTARVTTNIG